MPMNSPPHNQKKGRKKTRYKNTLLFDFASIRTTTTSSRQKKKEEKEKESRVPLLV
jgi:hypothetical protein